MTTTETATVAPPANYPPPGWSEGSDAQTFPLAWREDPVDHFWVQDSWRSWYSQPEAMNTSRVIEKLWDRNGTVVGPETVQALTLDDQGRYVPVPSQQSRDLRWSGDPYDGWRQTTAAVDPRQGTATLAFRTLEHDIRLRWAAHAARDDEEQEQRYQLAKLRCCPVCGDQHAVSFGSPFFGAATLCQRCERGSEVGAALRHYERYRTEIDGWLDENWQEWEPKPPQRQPGKGFHRGWR